ncbi:MAG: hypothetical protein AAGK74_12585 [Chloroflexota bacterium]
MKRIYPVEGENIIVVNNNQTLTAELVEENRATVREIMETMKGKVVLIINFTEATITFEDVLGILRGYAEGKRKDINQRAFSIFVGTDTFVDMIRNAIRNPQFGNVEIPYFQTMEQALEVARIYLETNASSDDDD